MSSLITGGEGEGVGRMDIYLHLPGLEMEMVDCVFSIVLTELIVSVMEVMMSMST
jgi:hypothetical protein